MIHAALESGINFVDTADVYSGGESEEIVGKALKGRRDAVVLATKFGLPMGPDANEARGCPRWIAHAVEQASLRRLDTDYIDLYQMHRPDHRTALDETLAALSDLVRSGKVRADRLLDAPGRTHRRGAVGRGTPRPTPLPHRATACVLDPVEDGRSRRAPHRPTPRHGGVDLRAAEQRLVVGTGRPDAGTPGGGVRGPQLRAGRPGQPGQAGGRRQAHGACRRQRGSRSRIWPWRSCGRIRR